MSKGSHIRGREAAASDISEDHFYDYREIIEAREQHPGAYEPLPWSTIARRGLAGIAILGLLVAGIELTDKDSHYPQDHSINR